MKTTILALCLACLASCSGGPQPINSVSSEVAQYVPGTSAAPPEGYELVWADEFEQDGLPNPFRWAYDTHRNAEGWYNDELQYYSAARMENSRVEDGVLVIEVRREDLSGQGEDWGGQDYTSARLFTRGKQAWQYGYFEVRAKLACGRGTWPAIWTLPEEPGRWPDSGEIDIMEHVGWDEGVVHGTVHTGDYNHMKGNQRAAQIRIADVCEAFHTYHLLWTADAIIVGVDGQDYFTYENTGEGVGAWPFDRPHHLILNVAVGGWGGTKGIDPEVFPARMEVDYVRVWQAE